jgi:hypothetical protein
MLSTDQCNCKADGLGSKVYGIATYLCLHTSLLGKCPQILPYWGSKNTLTPENILSMSTKYCWLVCNNPACRAELEYKPCNMTSTGTFTCLQCKTKFRVGQNPTECICKQNRADNGKTLHGWVCEHDNLDIACKGLKDFWSDRNNSKPSSMTKGSTKAVYLECRLCGNEEVQTPLKLSMRGCYECPACKITNDSLLLACPNIDQFWHPENTWRPTSVSRGSNVIIKLLCRVCGTADSRSARLLGISGSYTCGYCNSAAVRFPSLISEVADGTDLSKLSYGSGQTVKWKCRIPEHPPWYATVNDRTGQGHVLGCGKCANNVAMTYEEFVAKAKLTHGNKYVYHAYYPGFKLHESVVTILCPVHGLFQQNAHVHNNGSGCRDCAHRKSKLCIEIETWLDRFKVPYSREKTFPGLVHKSNLYYDYCIEYQNVFYLIEADGHQHFKIAGWDKSGLDELNLRTTRDLLKDQYAVEHDNVCLIRIPYTMIDQVKHILAGWMVKFRLIGHFVCTYSHYAERLQIRDPKLKIIVVPSPKLIGQPIVTE